MEMTDRRVLPGGDCYSDTFSKAVAEEIDPISLNDFDSWHFFKKTDGHVVTGPTLTNVMDIIVVIIS